MHRSYPTQVLAPSMLRFRRMGEAALIPTELTAIPVDNVLSKATTGLPRTCKEGTRQLALIAKPGDQIDITQQYEWKDGMGIFDSNTHHIRKLQHSTVRLSCFKAKFYF